MPSTYSEAILPQYHLEWMILKHICSSFSLTLKVIGQSLQEELVLFNIIEFTQNTGSYLEKLPIECG